jgi:hypothetical protein
VADDEPDEAPDDGDQALALAARALTNLDRAVRVLAIAGWVAAGLWAVATIAAFMTNWSGTDAGFSSLQGGAPVVESNRVPHVVELSLVATWEYLLIAVVALAASALVDVRRLPILLDDVD